MKSLLSSFSFSLPKQIPIIHLSDNTINILSYVSIIVSIGLFFAGLYLIRKNKKYGIRTLCSSFLLLINPIINLVLN
jgi:uncharacterized membrane protein